MQLPAVRIRNVAVVTFHALAALAGAWMVRVAERPIIDERYDPAEYRKGSDVPVGRDLDSPKHTARTVETRDRIVGGRDVRTDIAPGQLPGSIDRLGPSRLSSLRVGRSRNPFSWGYVWAQPREPRTRDDVVRDERQWQDPLGRRLLEEARARVEAVHVALESDLATEVQFGHVALDDVQFAAAGVLGLSRPFFVFPGRDVSIPAPPDATLSYYLGGRSIRDDQTTEALAVIRESMRARAKLRMQALGRGIELLVQGKGQFVDCAAFVIDSSGVRWIRQQDSNLPSNVVDRWNQVQDRTFAAIRELVR